MGSGGYNGGSPAVNAPKKSEVDVSSGARDDLDLPKNFEIVEAGEGLQNEHGGKQAEFGYLVRAKKAQPNSSTSNKLMPKRCFLRKREEPKKGKPESRWVAASVLVKYFFLEVRNFHLQNPDASRPFGLELREPVIE